MAQITVQDALVPRDHLQIERLVEAEAVANFRELLRRRTGIEEHRRGIARHQPDHSERHQRNESKHRQRNEQTPGDEAQQLPACLGFGDARGRHVDHVSSHVPHRRGMR
jgi:hypothetical protein